MLPRALLNSGPALRRLWGVAGPERGENLTARIVRGIPGSMWWALRASRSLALSEWQESRRIRIWAWDALRMVSAWMSNSRSSSISAMVLAISR